MNINIEQRKTSKDVVNLITVKNKVGLEVAFTNFGAAVYYISYPSKKTKENGLVTVSAKNFEEFVYGGGFFGKVVGRVAGRIEKGKFSIDGNDYQVDKNEFGNCLHGGDTTLSYRRFDFKIKTNKRKTDIIFSISSKDGESGFPGNIKVKAIYTIYENKKDLLLTFEGSTDKATVLNLTSHIYFSLNGGKAPIYDQELYLRSNKVASLDQELIIKGFETPEDYLDYSKSAKLRDKIRHPNLMSHHSHGMDHVFLFDGVNEKEPSAILKNDERRIEVYTDFTGIICYGCNYPSLKEGLTGDIIQENYALTLEALTPTNNIENITLRPNEKYSHYMLFKFY